MDAWRVRWCDSRRHTSHLRSHTSDRPRADQVDAACSHMLVLKITRWSCQYSYACHKDQRAPFCECRTSLKWICMYVTDVDGSARRRIQCKPSRDNSKKIYFGCRRGCPPAIFSTWFALCRIIRLKNYTKKKALAVNDLWGHTDKPGAFSGIVRLAGTPLVLLRPEARCNFGSI